MSDWRNAIRIAAVAALVVLALFLVRSALAEGVELTFLGGAGEVGGSCALIDTGRSAFLVDCGAFGSAGDRIIPPEPETVDFLVLTHAHSDHCGMIPELFEAGFSGRVYCTPPTAGLVPVMLRMARGFSRDRVSRDAFERALASLSPVEFGDTLAVGDVSIVFGRAEHLLGAAFVETTIRGDRGEMRLLFSGDLGSGASVLLRPLEQARTADYVVMESTYGAVERRRPETGPLDLYAGFAGEAGRALRDGGDVLIPAFTLGRTQEVIAVLDLFAAEGILPRGTLIFSDSPTAKKITSVYREHPGELSPLARKIYGGEMLRKPWHREVRSRTSMKVHDRPHEPAVFVSSSGNLDYANSPRHLVRMAGDGRSLLCIVGWQSPGSVGRRLSRGDSAVVVRCMEEGRMREYGIVPSIKVASFDAFSSHADSDGLICWLRGAGKPRRVFLVHGEPEQAGPLARRIEAELGLETVLPEAGDHYLLEFP